MILTCNINNKLTQKGAFNWKKIETDCNWFFSLKFSKFVFVVCNFCFNAWEAAGSYAFVIHKKFLKFHSEQRCVICIIKKMN